MDTINFNVLMSEVVCKEFLLYVTIEGGFVRRAGQIVTVIDFRPGGTWFKFQLWKLFSL